MNRIVCNTIFCTAVLSLCAATELAYARGGAAGAGIGAAEAGAIRGGLGKANVAATQTAEQAASPQSDSIESTTKTAQTPVDPCAVPTLMTGAYMGLQLGYGTYAVRNRVVNPFTTTYVSDPVGGDNGFTGGIFAGYGRILYSSWFYLGGEVFINANNFDQRFGISSGPGSPRYNNQTNSGTSFGFGLLPGIMLTKSTLTYVRIGWNVITIKTNENVNGGAISSTSKNMDGLALGIGFNTLISTNYSLRSEFDHVFLSSYNTGGIYKTLVSPSSNQFTMAIIYNFG